MILSADCVYTIRDSAELARIAASTGSATLAENTYWKSGAEIFGKASAQGERVPLLFSAAERWSGLIFWALLTDVDAQPAHEDTSASTTYSFESLVAIDPPLPQSALRLRVGRQLSDSHQRPYVLCQTPGFLPK